jgi:hypothetical protein
LAGQGLTRSVAGALATKAEKQESEAMDDPNNSSDHQRIQQSAGWRAGTLKEPDLIRIAW